MGSEEVKPKDTPSIYEREALRYDRERSRDLVEREWLERFAEGLPDEGVILDLGCGSGEPIAGWLIEKGYQVIGVDVAPSLLATAKVRWPDGDWRHGDMRELDLSERFHGIIAWDSFFHLTPDEQVSSLPVISRHLRPGGSLMITVGPDAGETSGIVGESRVYHASLSPATYAGLLEQEGLQLRAFRAEDPACQNHTVLMARKN